MKTFIAVPSMDSVPAIFAQSLSMLEKVGDCVIGFQVGSLVYNSRNQLARRAIEMGSDYILWLDSDMMFEPDTLKRMTNIMGEKDLDILSGIYFRRCEPYTPVLCDKLSISEGGCDHHNLEEVPEGLFEVEGIGFGCVLMKTDVVFDVLARFHDAFSPIHAVGEDLSFCWRARECGYKIFADSSIQLGHCGHTIITKQFFEAYKTAKENEG